MLLGAHFRFLFVLTLVQKQNVLKYSKDKIFSQIERRQLELFYAQMSALELLGSLDPGTTLQDMQKRSTEIKAFLRSGIIKLCGELSRGEGNSGETKYFRGKRHPSLETSIHPFTAHKLAQRRTKAYGLSDKSDVIHAAYYILIDAAVTFITEEMGIKLSSGVEDLPEEVKTVLNFQTALHSMDGILEILYQAPVS